MGPQELARWHVLKLVLAGQLTRMQAAERVNLSYRHVPAAATRAPCTKPLPANVDRHPLRLAGAKGVGRGMRGSPIKRGKDRGTRDAAATGPRVQQGGPQGAAEPFLGLLRFLPPQTAIQLRECERQPARYRCCAGLPT